MAISAAEPLMRRIVRRSGQAIVSFTANSSSNHLSLPPLIPPPQLLRFECQYFPRKAWIVKLIASISRAKTSDKRTRIERGSIKWGGWRKCAGKGDDEGGHVEKAQKTVDEILIHGLRTELNRKRSPDGTAAARGKLLHPVSSAAMSPRDAANTRVAV